MRAIVVLIIALAAGCRQTPASAPEPAASDAPMLAGSYEAISRTAMSITGDLRMTDEMLTFSLGSTYRTRLAARVSASDEYAAGAGSWADLLNVNPTDRVEVRAVVEERVDATAPNGGLCRPAAVTHLALVLSSDPSGAPALKLAAFKGGEPPGPKGAAENLCGTFLYGSAGRV